MRSAYASAILAIGAVTVLPAFAADVTKLRSAGALAYGADNVPFVGDTKAGGVHAYEFQAAAFDSQKDVFGGRAETFEGWVLVDKIDRKIGGLLGIDPMDVQINDMVVHRPSQQVYLSVHRGHGPDAEPLIVKINRGKVEIVDLSSVKHSFTDVGPVPTDEKLEFGGMQRDLTITDIDYYRGEIFVSGVATGSFASKLRRITYPFDAKLKSSSIDMRTALRLELVTTPGTVSHRSPHGGRGCFRQLGLRRYCGPVGLILLSFETGGS